MEHGVSYEDARAAQLAALERLRVEPDGPGLLLAVEHIPVVTLGRGGDPAHLRVGVEGLRAAGVAYAESERGGDVTYHGPGQATLYPVLPLDWWKRDLHWYLRQLEEVVMHYLAGHGIAGERVPGRTGVWVAEGKLAAIGIAVRHWIAYHGLAVNVQPDLDHFGLIVPCGIADRPVTSLAALTGRRYEMDEEMRRLAAAFVAVFPGAVLEEALPAE